MKYYKRLPLSTNNPLSNRFAVEKDGRIVTDSRSALQIPTGVVSDRPLDASAGMIRYNSELGFFEAYTSSTWELLSSSSTGSSSATAINLAGGVRGSIPYQTSAGATAFIGIGSTGTVLTSNGTTATWATPTGGASSTATNIAGGTSGSIPYQTSAGATAFINIGGTGTILQSNGLTATWVSTSSLGIGGGSNGNNFDSIQIISTNTTAVNRTLYIITSTLTLTLPATPGVLHTVGVSNLSTSTNSVLGRNGEKIMGLSEDMTIDVVNSSFVLYYSGSAYGWIVV